MPTARTHTAETAAATLAAELPRHAPHTARLLAAATTPDTATPAALAWLGMLAETASARPTGTMAALMQARHGQELSTLQLSSSGSAWVPGARTVDARTRAGSVRLGDSWREYRGARVLAATDTALLIQADPGGFDQLCLYVDAAEAESVAAHYYAAQTAALAPTEAVA